MTPTMGIPPNRVIPLCLERMFILLHLHEIIIFHFTNECLKERGQPTGNWKKGPEMRTGRGRGGLVFQKQGVQERNQKDTQGHVIWGPPCRQSPHGNG